MFFENCTWIIYNFKTYWEVSQEIFLSENPNFNLVIRTYNSEVMKSCCENIKCKTLKIFDWIGYEVLYSLVQGNKKDMKWTVLVYVNE